MDHHMMTRTLKAASWLLGAALVLSCHLKPESEIEQVGSGGGRRANNPGGTEVVEQWATITPASQLVPVTESAANRLQGVMTGSAVRLEFVNCDVPPCVTRLQAGSLAEARASLKAISDSYGGRVSFTARENLDAYTGQSFQLDVVLDTDQTRAVPEADEELLLTD